MNPLVARLKTPQECEVFAKNARNRNAPQLAEEARQRAIHLRAEIFGAKTEVERECLEAVYAYEELLSAQKGSKQRAGRTWPMIHKYGILPAVERIVLKRNESVGYTALAEMGLKEFAFEAVILRHPKFFSQEAVARSQERLVDENGMANPLFQLAAKEAAQTGSLMKRQLGARTAMRYWWVNQNQTYLSEVPGGFLWSPKTRADGARNQFYENMQLVTPGDVVFSFYNSRIKAVGVATGRAESSLKPDFGSAGAGWLQEGWLVPVEFRELRLGIRPKDHMTIISPHLPAKYSPLQHSGNGLQSVYLAELPPSMAEVLINLLGDEYTAAVYTLRAETDTTNQNSDEQLAAVLGRTDIGATTKTQIIQSRRGQGLFRANVRLNETGCRVTRITDPQHLRASHIKPWRDCSDEEKLNGCNGLLLAPHVDHLFDRGLISFTDKGELIISPFLDKQVLSSWGIPCDLSVGGFNEKQMEFLDYHRRNVFKQAE